MNEIKQGFQRELLVNRPSDNVDNTKWVDSDGYMVGIKKAGEKVLAIDFIKAMKSRGLNVMYTGDCRKV